MSKIKVKHTLSQMTGGSFTFSQKMLSIDFVQTVNNGVRENFRAILFDHVSSRSLANLLGLLGVAVNLQRESYSREQKAKVGPYFSH